MKLAALAVFCVLIALPAEAGQRHRQDNVSPTCDNNGRCTTLGVTARASGNAPSSHGRIRTSERKPHRVVDANGNSTMVTVQTAYGFNITVHPAYASKFLKFFALLRDVAIKCRPTSPGAGHRGARMSRGPTTTSVPPAIFRWVGIAGPSSCTT